MDMSQIVGQVPSSIGLSNAGQGSGVPAQVQPPAPAPQPAAPPPPSPQGMRDKSSSDDMQKALDQIEANLSPEEKAANSQAAAKEPASSDIHSQLDAIDADAGLHPAKEEHPLLSSMKDFLSTEIKTLKAKFRVGAARTEKEAETALEQVFKDDPEGLKAFRKIPQKQLVAIGFPLVNLMVNKLQEMPEMMGKFAGAATQAGMQTAGVATGAAIGSTAGPIGTVVGGAIGGGVGGFLGSKAAKTVDDYQAEFLNQRDPNFKYENKLDSLASVLQNDYVQGAVGAVAGGVTAHAAVRAASHALAESGVSESTASDLRAMESGKSVSVTGAPIGREEKSFPKFVTALKNTKEVLFPWAETEGTQAGLSPGRDAIGASTANIDEVGKTIGMLRDEASKLQIQKKSFLKPEEFTSFIQKELSQHGVVLDEKTGLVNYGETKLGSLAYKTTPPKQDLSDYGAGVVSSSAPSDPMIQSSSSKGEWVRVGGGEVINKTELDKTAPSNIRVLMDLNDKLVKISRFGENQGLTIGQTKEAIDLLDSYANFEKTNVAPNRSESLFRNARTALTTDNISHMASLFNGEDTIESQLFRHSMTEYSQKSEALKTIESMFSTPAKQDLLVKKISNEGSAQALDAVRSMRQILGDDSPQWQNLRSDLIGRFIDKSTAGGKIAPEKAAAFFDNRDNKMLLTELFAGQEKDVNIFRSVLAQGEALRNAEPGLSAKTKAVIGKLVDVGSKHIPGSGFIKTVLGISGNNKAVVDYTSEAIQDAVQSSIGSEQRRILMQQKMAIDQFRSQSRIVDLPVKIGDRSTFVRKYLPIGAAVTTGERMQVPPQEIPQSSTVQQPDVQ